MFEPDEEVKKIALGIDVAGDGISGTGLDEMDQRDRVRDSFLTQDVCLLNGIKRARRQHPLSGSGRVDTGITKEREKIMFLSESDLYIGYK